MAYTPKPAAMSSGAAARASKSEAMPEPWTLSSASPSREDHAAAVTSVICHQAKDAKELGVSVGCEKTA